MKRDNLIEFSAEIVALNSYCSGYAHPFTDHANSVRKTLFLAHTNIVYFQPYPSEE